MNLRAQPRIAADALERAGERERWPQLTQDMNRLPNCTQCDNFIK